MNEYMYNIFERIEGGETYEQLKKSEPNFTETILPSLFQLEILFSPDKEIPEKRYDIRPDTPSPKRLTVFPTTGCNLKCIYCYANGGDDTKKLDKHIYEITLECYFKMFVEELHNVGSDKRQPAHLSIHGGGEPTFDFPLLRYIIERFTAKAKTLSIPSKISMVSNGTYNQNVNDWILASGIGVSFSLDGPPEIHNLQRPFSTGKPSFHKIAGNIKRLIDVGRAISIRSTTTADALPFMQDTIELAKEMGISAVHFEPVSITGRCKTSNVMAPCKDEFSKRFLECFLLGLKYDIEVSYSGMRCFDHYHNRFCSACGENICLTPDGDITTCYEVLDKTDSASEIFFIGKVDRLTKEISFNNKKIRFLKSRITENIKYCSSCFLRYNCAGDCLAKTYRSSAGNIFKPDPYRCAIAENVNKELIAWLADGVIEPRDEEKYGIISYNIEGDWHE